MLEKDRKGLPCNSRRTQSRSRWDRWTDAGPSAAHRRDA